MMVDLDHKALIFLVMGQSPYYNLHRSLESRSLGDFSDNTGWHWDDGQLSHLTDESLYELYRRCLDSWNQDPNINQPITITFKTEA